MHHVAGSPVLDVLPLQTSPVERMPAIENLNFLPDMGRMTPTFVTDRHIGATLRSAYWSQLMIAVMEPTRDRHIGASAGSP
jgi:hypothetical protein